MVLLITCDSLVVARFLAFSTNDWTLGNRLDVSEEL